MGAMEVLRVSDELEGLNATTAECVRDRRQGDRIEVVAWGYDRKDDGKETTFCARRGRFLIERMSRSPWQECVDQGQREQPNRKMLRAGQRH